MKQLDFFIDHVKNIYDDREKKIGKKKDGEDGLIYLLVWCLALGGNETEQQH